ncbi:hypothetical protein Fcan01_00716 [Folsomia candida]|uniref:Uncharacterized protein n=1 Tax=Folsomia candida TaxID=158441 RepID=A0A226EWZ2_FOLCA|nr:hypothetical protein Fcan01_00716 [Folsomia candida]
MGVSSKQDKIVLRGTMQVKVLGPNKEVRNVRVLVDSGSDISYIQRKLADDLKLKPVGKRMFQTEVFGGGHEIAERKEYSVNIQGINGGKENLQMQMFSQEYICGVCDPVPYGPWVNELMKMKVYLTDVASDPSEIHILLGSNHIGRILTGRMAKVSPTIIATETTVGWYLNGEASVPKQRTMAQLCIAKLAKTEDISVLWDLDILGIKDSALRVSTEEHDQQVKEDFQKKLRRADDGRYVVKLPWISESIPLPHIRGFLEAEGIVEVYAEKGTDHDGHYLPHRPVFKPDSLTTPVRPVFDASCRVGNQPSLNQCLEKGPNLVEMILPILLRFRKEKVGAISDIMKAFQMIQVDGEHRKYQRFLWWEDQGKKLLKVYQHCRVIFGMNCSPFILAAVLDFHLSQVPENEKKTSLELLRSLYVDNCVTSFDTLKEYEKFKNESTMILERAKMDLRQWESNADQVMENEITSVLGYKWNKKSDQLYCDIPTEWGEEGDPVITKRSVLSLAAQVFDPIGYTSPAVLQLKLLLQESWAQDMKWDEQWDEVKSAKVTMWYKQMSSLGEIKIPRWAVNNSAKLQLHIFTDASKDGYGGIVFVRCQERGLESATVQLLLAKSRIAPLQKKPDQKNVTIPRLELLGCLIGARLAETVKRAMGYEDIPTVYWTDSTTALAWIRRDGDWGTFVGNRVRQILKISNKEEWRHVPGKINPADLPSRGCSPTELLLSKWWEGPDWLRESEDNWQKSPGETDEDEVLAEVKRSTWMKVARTVPVASFVAKFASYIKNVRVVGYAVRILKGMDKEELRKAWTIAELRAAEVVLLKVMQERYFPDVKQINLRVSKMKDELLHVRTKLEYREDTEAFRFPILQGLSDGP